MLHQMMHAGSYLVLLWYNLAFLVGEIRCNANVSDSLFTRIILLAHAEFKNWFPLVPNLFDLVSQSLNRRQISSLVNDFEKNHFYR